MAKMFYTLEEAAQRLGMSPEDVLNLGRTGQLQEFRDRDRLMFKKDQVDLLAGDASEDDDIQLADSTAGEPMSLANSGTGSALSIAPEDSKGDTGVSIFDPDETEVADANADTLVSGNAFNPADIGFDAGASGSGLANLALEPDDTSLGGDLMRDLGDSSAGTNAGMPAAGTGFGFDAAGSAFGAAAAGAGAGSLFEGTPADTDFTPAAQAALLPAAQSYDGPWSGLAGGMAVGACLALLAAIGVVILSMTGSGASALLGSMTTNTLYIVLGGGIALVAVCAAAGWAMLRKS
jgi:hypothetical protein